jgi:hypothetical protein
MLQKGNGSAILRKRFPEYPNPTVSEWSVGEVTEGREPHAFDLEERTAQFGEAIIRFVKRVPRGPDNDRLIGQLVGCGTSVGANYCDCIIGRCRKESKETKFFLRMMATAEPKLAPDARKLFREAKELHLIFCAMFRNSS